MSSIDTTNPEVLKRLLDIYQSHLRSVDDLPYTQDFSEIASQWGVNEDDEAGKAELFRALLRLRKAGRLPRVSTVTRQEIPLSPSQRELLGLLLVRHLGTLGSRDRLPYTAEFSRLYDEFVKQTNTELSKYDLWRAILSTSKLPSRFIDSLHGRFIYLMRNTAAEKGVEISPEVFNLWSLVVPAVLGKSEQGDDLSSSLRAVHAFIETLVNKAAASESKTVDADLLIREAAGSSLDESE